MPANSNGHNGQSDTEALVAPAGRFRIYLGAASGVGKTCAMLDEGWRRYQRGSDVVVGWVETFGRPYTERLLRDLEVIPRTTLKSPEGQTVEEMDLPRILERRPEVVLVDNLAHDNPPGAPHAHRWEDVMALLEADISVITTLDVSSIESLAGAVEALTGVPVVQRVPDLVVRWADQIELVDSSPEQLRRRMLHGNIYAKSRIPQALTSLFRTENLAALRQLALRYVAGATEEELLTTLQSEAVGEEVAPTDERVLVGVSGAEGDEDILRHAARLSARSRAELAVLHVVNEDGSQPVSPEVLDRLRRLAAQVGGTWHQAGEVDMGRALLEFARDHQITEIVLGSSRAGRLRALASGSVLQHVLREAAGAGINVHVIARSPKQAGRQAPT
jgi:two-component system sensor histidine kinase KdpD